MSCTSQAVYRDSVTKQGGKLTIEATILWVTGLKPGCETMKINLFSFIVSDMIHAATSYADTFFVLYFKKTKEKHFYPNKCACPSKDNACTDMEAAVLTSYKYLHNSNYWQSLGQLQGAPLIKVTLKKVIQPKVLQTGQLFLIIIITQYGESHL